MHFFSLNLEKFTPDRKFLHRHVCGVCDKYEVWVKIWQRALTLRYLDKKNDKKEGIKKYKTE